MRWIIFIIIAYLTIVVQTSLGDLLSCNFGSMGRVSPDFVAMLAVFVAVNVRSGTDAVLAGTILGWGMDLASGGATVVGPMPLAYALASMTVYRVRGAFFRDRILSRAMLALGFCLLAYPIWVTLQTLFNYGSVAAGDYGKMLLQAISRSVYTALLMPIAYLIFEKVHRWLMVAPAGRSRRSGR